MKKLTKIISLILAFAMVALVLASCGATPEQRVATAMAKMATAKKTDCTANVTVKFDMGGMSMEMPMEMVMKTDVTDAEKPVVYSEVKMTMMGQKTETTTFYKDGYLYTNVDGVKVKVRMSVEDMMKDATSGFDMAKIFEAKKDKVDDTFAITENEDGTITVKMTVTKAEFAADLADFANDIAAGTGFDGSVEISDTVFEFVVDKDNNVSGLKTSMNMSITVAGKTMAVSYVMDFTYKAAGEDFTITLPTDLDSYIG